MSDVETAVQVCEKCETRIEIHAPNVVRYFKRADLGDDWRDDCYFHTVHTPDPSDRRYRLAPSD